MWDLVSKVTGMSRICTLHMSIFRPSPSQQHAVPHPSRLHAVHDSGFYFSHSFDRVLLPIPLPSILHQDSVPNCYCGISRSARNWHTSGWLQSHSFDRVLLPIPLPSTLHQDSVPNCHCGISRSARMSDMMVSS